MKLVTKAELVWVKQRLMVHLGIGRLVIAEDLAHTASYPDIWVQRATATITVTRAWASKSLHQRRIELTHECLHLTGLGHGARERRMGYYSHPEKDIYSRRVYNQHLR